MPTYNLPDFNLLASMWTPGLVPAADPPALIDLPVQKYIFSRMTPVVTSLIQQLVLLRFPTGTLLLSVVGQIFEVPQGSGVYFKSFQIYMMHEGFPNEYITIVCSPVNGSGFLIAGRTNP